MRSRPALLLLAATGLVGPLSAGCTSSSPHRAAASTTAVPSTAVPTVATTAPPTTARAAPTTPPTTVYAPSSPQPSPDAAAAALVDDWSTGNRSGADAVAAPDAVAALFAQPYPAGYLQSRGCTDPSTNPGTCTYANRETGGLYEIGVTRTGTAWYVSTVNVES